MIVTDDLSKVQMIISGSSPITWRYWTPPAASSQNLIGGAATVIKWHTPKLQNINLTNFTYTYIPYNILHPISLFSLLLLFSKRLCRFSSLSRASSSSCCCRHLWKFSTTTPTNMLSTKKLTMRRKEMKNSSIQGSWFLFGYREARGGWGGIRSDKSGWGRRRWGESTNKTMQILSQQEHCQLTSMHLPAFFPIHHPFLLKNPPFLLEIGKFKCCLRLTLNRTKNTIKYLSL